MFRFTLYTFFLLVAFSCSQEQQEMVDKQVSLLHYAENLRIFKKNKQIIIHLIDPESKKIEKKYVLFRDKAAQLPEGHIPLKTPIKSLVALSSTHIGMMAKLNLSSIISGVSNKLYVHDAIVLKRFKEGKVLEMGDQNMIPVEAIVASKADLLMYSGFGKAFPHADQLEKMGTICMANYDWREAHPLGKAEWILLFGYLCGKQKEAMAYFKQVEKEYLKLKRIAEKGKEKPTAFSGNMAGGVWHSPAGESYNAILLKDANCRYVFDDTKGTGSVEKSLEQMLVTCQNTSYWFNPGFASREELLRFQPKANLFNAFKQNRIYSYSYSGNEFWERSAIEPQHVLSDLILILHPELHIKQKPYFYRQLN